MEMYEKTSGILADIIAFIKSFIGEMRSFIDGIRNDFTIEEE